MNRDDYERAAQVDEDLDEDQALDIAFPRLVHSLAGTREDTDVGVFEATVRAIDAVESIQERVDELENENEQLRTRLDKLGDIGEEKTSKEQKIASIVTFADNQRGDDQDAIAVKPSTIQGLVDVCRRYSYDLVDDMIDEFDWAHDPTEIQRYGSVERDTSDKSVVIDFEGVHGAAVPVNKFTTTAQGTGSQTDDLDPRTSHLRFSCRKVWLC